VNLACLGPQAVHQEGWELHIGDDDDDDDDDDAMPEETVEWVTPLATFNRKGSALEEIRRC
jgi:hypothetical protein